MILKTSQQNIPIDGFSKLRQFESELENEIKRLLNDSFKHIHVGMMLEVIDWQGIPVKNRNNASIFLEGSLDLLDKINSYISSRDDIEPYLRKATLLVKLTLTKKEMPNIQEPQSKRKEGDNTPDFFPTQPKYHFDQIILPEHLKKDIYDAVKILECKDLIYYQWGFGEVDPVPRSILNFYGEPGTGKTMCAHAIANHLGKQILALNYAQIESKYVGEAAKNLQKAFDVAKQTDSVLFFDEADSFLGKRIENVTQGSDQALNSLRSQMLILLEEFEGVVLFATNLVTNFDAAFESRILKHIRFELPNQEARAAIIKKMLPSRLPLVETFTDDQIMEAAALIDGFSGREIKGAVLELLLTKADKDNPNVVFSIDDLYEVLKKKKQEKVDLKAEEERRVKKKIEKKLKEKAEEARALKEHESNAKSEEEEPITSKQESSNIADQESESN